MINSYNTFMAADLQSRVRISDSNTPPFEFPDDFFVDSRNHGTEEECENSESVDTLVIPFALKSLNYFNSKEQTDFELVVDGPTNFGVYFINNPILHINFVAQSPASKHSSLFYAEVQTTSFRPTENDDEIKVFGCSMLRQVDSGNPRGFGCGFCVSETLIHPGPLSGYGVHKGDLFEESLFWEYRCYDRLNLITFRNIFERNKEFYTVCAKKAIQHLNSMAVCNWELSEVVAAMDTDGSAIHVNFTVTSSDISSPMLCFAELALPEELYYKDWNMVNEPFLEIRDCCIMKEVKSETQFGRVCGICLDQLIHPGPAYGYCSIVGDDFAGKDFKRVGCGVF